MTSFEIEEEVPHQQQHQNHHRFIPDHAVPMTMSRLIGATGERIPFGTLDVVRVNIMGTLVSVSFNDGEVQLEIMEQHEEHKCNITVTKILNEAFKKEHADTFQPGDLLEIFGKVRILENEKIFLNAFSIRKATQPQYETFKIICTMAEEYYHNNTPILPGGAGSKTPNDFGLKTKTGSLNRFPIGMLEESSSVENNMGKWPAELEQLAAQIAANDFKQLEESEDEEEDEEEEEEEDLEDEVEQGEEGKEDKVKLREDVEDCVDIEVKIEEEEEKEEEEENINSFDQDHIISDDSFEKIQ